VPRRETDSPQRERRDPLFADHEPTCASPGRRPVELRPQAIEGLDRVDEAHRPRRRRKKKKTSGDTSANASVPIPRIAGVIRQPPPRLEAGAEAPASELLDCPPASLGVPFGVPPASFGVAPASFGVPPSDGVQSMQSNGVPGPVGMSASFFWYE
jgi:hypothetical protein